MYEFFATFGLVVGIPASIATLVGVAYAAYKTRAWPRVRDWLYHHTNRYRIEQIQTHSAGLSNVVAIEMERAREQDEQLEKQLANLRKIVTEALWKVLAVQTNTDRFLDNHASIVELMAMLDKMATQPAQPKSGVDQLGALVADLVELQAKFLRGTVDNSPAAVRIREAARDSKERANHTE